ncbi:MAG: hypothetical protein ING71_17405 [Rhodocyclaceae bacterium]|nr:hypothetical protein [Rhodocyclaceae bacterium]
MTDNTTLDAAIEAAENDVDITWKGDMRAFSKALIAHLFTNLEPPEGATCYEVDLFNDAKRALLKAAALEVES